MLLRVMKNYNDLFYNICNSMLYSYKTICDIMLCCMLLYSINYRTVIFLVHIVV